MSKSKAKYNSYINSAAWRKKRELVFERDGNKCRRCPATTKLHCHHLTYAHFGNEPLEDLLTLCFYCHAKEHGEPEEPAKKKKARARGRGRPKVGICRMCGKDFNDGKKIYAGGGGYYCKECVKKKRLQKTKVKQLNPVTLKGKGTQAAIEEHNWKNL